MKRTVIAAIATCFCLSAEAASTDPWTQLTQRDVQAIHDLLRDNHPGPVDPLNPEFREWLESGLQVAMKKAETVRSLDDYRLALQQYTNGFRDGHIGAGILYFPDRYRWPGFVARADGAGNVVIAKAEPDSGVTDGTRLLSCDGRPLDSLLSEHTDPYYWNAALPHERYAAAERLFYNDPNAAAPEFKICRFSTGEMPLQWRTIGRPAMMEKINGAPRKPQLEFKAGIWFVHIPTFGYTTPEQIADIRALIADVAKNADAMRRETVVFDVRGNHGGDSEWGERIGSALWGDAWIKWFDAQSDDTVDWRASPANLAHMNDLLVQFRQNNQAQELEDFARARDAVAAALKAHQDYGRVAGHKAPETAPPPNPVAGKVYLLSDLACGSACLDFADLMHAIPGVTQIGLPTYADTLYLESDTRTLPSNLARFSYATKVYRDRKRGNNEWYEPKIRWPGGDISDDDAVSEWIASLPQAGR